jgi:hypothetical protein
MQIRPLPFISTLDGALTLSIDMDAKSVFRQGSNNSWLTSTKYVKLYLRM